jgi:endonuclease IV
MLFGAQVRQAGGLLAALRRAEAMGAEVMQVFAQSARQWRFPEASPERAAELGAAWPASSTVRAVVCHAPYLVNLGTPDDALYERSCRTLTDNLGAVVAMGGIGLVVHLGSHLGAGLDRHENPGWGEIGADGFRSLLGHPALQHLPAVLEVPGADGKGPGPAELATLRHMHADGLARRRGG